MSDMPVKEWIKRINSRLSVRLVLFLPIIIFLAIAGVEFCAIWFLNGGTFTYSLDDAYIHLSLAENIARGHYGLNPGEFSSPSSSIVWPFILALFARGSFFEFVPLIINLTASVCCLLVAGFLSLRIFEPLKNQNRLLALAATTLLIFGGNLVGAAFTGMEHSLQLLVALALVSGLISFCQTGKYSRWLPAAIVLAPLVRYEMLALSAPAIWILCRNKKVKSATILFLCMAGLLCGFSFFLHSLGLGFFPNSVVAKSAIIAHSGAASQVVQNIMQGVLGREGRGRFLFALFLGFGALRFSRQSERAVRLMSEWACLAIALHFCFGRFGWFDRYELYVWVSSVMTMGFVIIRRFGMNRDVMDSPVALIVLLCFFCMTSYLRAAIMTPIAANNIYEQQFQMRRFITEFYKKPVAVNDVGLVSFRNNMYVLDLTGLASKEVLELRRAGSSVVWMDELAAEHHVDFALIYATCDKPEHWIHLADWSLSRRCITPACETVGVYSINPLLTQEQLLVLEKFRKTLPRGVKWTWASPFDNKTN